MSASSFIFERDGVVVYKKLECYLYNELVRMIEHS
jgi:hypothetical protein